MRICLVLGAGASLANALYFRPVARRDTRPPLDTTFFETVQARRINISPSLRSYLRGLLRTDPTPDRIKQLRMEEFFKDIYFDFQEDPNNAALRTAYTDLVKLYTRVLRETTTWLCEPGRPTGPIGKLIAQAAGAADDVSVITFNHDLVIENEIAKRARLASRWCLDVGYGSLSANLTPVPPTSGDAFPLHSHGLCDHSRPIRVLKLHGSLNWAVRLNSRQPTARTLSGEGGNAPIQLLAGRIPPRAPVFRRAGGRPRDRGRAIWPLWPVVIPPIYAKQALRRRLRLAWDDAQNDLAQADRIVFFGYSLPALDIDAEKLIERSLAGNTNARWIDVINPDSASAARYAGLAPSIPVRWYPSLARFDASTALRA